MPSAREVRRIWVDSNCAASSRTFVVASETCVARPPMTPPIATGLWPSAMTSMAGLRLHPVSSMETMCSPSRARRTMIFASLSVSKSKAWSGWPHSNST